MAIEFIGWVGRDTGSGLPGTGLYVKIPPGTELGDLLILFVSTAGATNTAIASGWTLVEVPSWVFWSDPGTASTANMFVLVKFADANDVLAGSLGTPHGGGPWVIAHPIDTSGASQSTDLTIVTVGYRNAPVLPTAVVRGSDPLGTSHTIPAGILAADANAIVIAGGKISQDHTDTITAAGFTLRAYEAGGSFATPLFTLDKPAAATGLLGPWPATSSAADTIHWEVLLLTPNAAQLGIYVPPASVPLGSRNTQATR